MKRQIHFEPVQIPAERVLTAKQVMDAAADLYWQVRTMCPPGEHPCANNVDDLERQLTTTERWKSFRETNPAVFYSVVSPLCTEETFTDLMDFLAKCDESQQQRRQQQGEKNVASQ